MAQSRNRMPSYGFTGMANRSVTDLVGASKSMPGADSAELYSDTAAQVCKRSLDLLFQGTSPMVIHEEQVILDIGCGTGEATMCILDRIPGVKTIKAVDRSEEFIDYAKEFNAAPEISYECLNAEEQWPEEWRERFTMIYSNYVFHWIKDHNKLLRQINVSMKVNGELLVQFFHSAKPANNEMTAARKAAEDCGIANEMQTAMIAIKKQVPIWNDAAAYSRLISSLGFRVKTCCIEDRQYKCESRFERAGMTVTVSPFMNHVPQEKKLLFATKYVSYLKDPYTIFHKAVVVHAVKINNC